MILQQLGVLLLRFKLARRHSSYFELNSVCTFESKELTKHVNNVFIVGKMRKTDKLDCSTPYFRI